MCALLCLVWSCCDLHQTQPQPHPTSTPNYTALHYTNPHSLTYASSNKQTKKNILPNHKYLIYINIFIDVRPTSTSTDIYSVHSLSVYLFVETCTWEDMFWLVWCVCVRGYCSAVLMSYFMSSGALQRLDLLLFIPYNSTTIACKHHTNNNQSLTKSNLYKLTNKSIHNTQGTTTKQIM